MTINQTQIMWTCLPNGFTVSSPTTVQVSLVVSPLLTSTANTDTIAGTVFQNWPAYVKAIASVNGFNLVWNNGSTTTAGTLVDHFSAAPPTAAQPNLINVDASLLWQAIFLPGTPVVPASQASATPQFRVHSYDAAKIAIAVRTAHQYAVQSHATHGKLVLTGYDPYSTLLAEHKKARDVRHKMVHVVRGVSSGATHEALKQAYLDEVGDLELGYELLRHWLFFNPGKHRTDKDPSAVPMVKHDAATTTPPPSDFNSLVGHLGAQPALQRKLGLILDLTFPIPSTLYPQLLVTPPATATGMPVQVIWGEFTSPTSKLSTALAFPTASYQVQCPYVSTATLSATTHIQPSTRVDMTRSIFRTSSAGFNGVTPTSGGSINNGCLPLGDTTQYQLITEDTEGAPFKLDALVGTSTSDVTPSMPALRTQGIAVALPNRDSVLTNATSGLMTRQQNLASQYLGGGGNPLALQMSAEDVVRGYAVDILLPATSTAPATWQSLCLRDTRVYWPALAKVQGYSSSTMPLMTVLRDEGYTKATAATSTTNPEDASGNATNVADLNLHTVLFGWEGWSLAVQRPGRAITAAVPAGDIVQTETPVQPVNTSAANFPSCQITVRARAGSLPPLRFGHSYTLRARVIDLAGNDMSVASANVPQYTTQWANPLQSTIAYLRYEPVPNPVLVLQNPLTEGEHLENLVIRSNPWGYSPATGPAVNMNATNYAAASPASKPMNAYSATCARWVVPPKGAWGQAEQLGAFDGYYATMSKAIAADVAAGAAVPGLPYTTSTSANAAAFFGAKNALYLCSQKEAGLLTDAEVWDTGNLSVSAPSWPNPVKIITPPTAMNLPPPTDPGQPLGTGQYNLLTTTSTPYIPYLPDANAQGIFLQQLAATEQPGVPAGAPSANGAPLANKLANPIATVVSSATRTYMPRPQRAWPELDLPQFVLHDLTTAPAGVGGTVAIKNPTSNPMGLDPATAQASPAPAALPTNMTPPAGATPIDFYLAPGQQVSFYYGSSVATPSVMAGSAAGAVNIPTYAPYRTITMVHAVQQPAPPNYGVTLTNLTTPTTPQQLSVVNRNAGDTFVTFTGYFTVDGTTSNAVDLTTAWADYVDTELTSGVEQISDGSNRRYVIRSGRLASWTLSLADSSCAFLAGHTTNTLTEVVTTAYPPTVALPTPEPQLQIQGPALVQQCGDTKTRQIFFQLTATSRFREFFPASLQANGANFQRMTPSMPLSAAELLNTPGVRIPSTARPTAPKILYVVPTFGWSSSVELSNVTNTRTGRGLRVFVDRPWFTTGDTEMLGVVVNPTPAAGTNPATAAAALQAYTSQWGQDPIQFPQADVPLVGGAGSAQLNAIYEAQVIGGTTYDNVPLFESSSPVSVVAYPPGGFDPVRNLWYFDIEFAPSGMESPFVRLALVRFQPNSIGSPAFPNATSGDLRISKVVLADMVKIAPDRTASYSIDTTTGNVFVTVTGQVHAAQVWPASGVVPTGTVAADTVNTLASYGRAVYAQIQTCPGTITTPGELDWQVVGSPIPLTPFQLAGEAASSTTLSYMYAVNGQPAAIPKPAITAGAHYQLLITEHEIFATDADAAFPSPALRPGLQYGAGAAPPSVSNYPTGMSISLPSAPSGDSMGPGVTSRIIFSDVLPLHW